MSKEKGREAYEQAHALFDKGRDDDGMEKIKEAIAEDPQHAEALFVLAHYYEICGQGEKAVETYEAVLAANPDFIEAMNNIGDIYYNNQEYKKAGEAFKKAIRINPKYVVPHVNLAITLIKTGDLEAAKRQYDFVKTYDEETGKALLKVIENNTGMIYTKIMLHECLLSKNNDPLNDKRVVGEPKPDISKYKDIEEDDDDN